MDLLTISDVSEKSGLPKPTIYRMFNELSDLIPHKRVGRKILFPEEAVTKVREIRQLTAEEGFTYSMIREDVSAPSSTPKKTESKTQDMMLVKSTSNVSQAVPQNIVTSFDGLSEDLRLLAAQIDRQNDLLSQLIGQSQAVEEPQPSIIRNEIKMDPRQTKDENGKLVLDQINSTQERDSKESKTGQFWTKWVNFWAGRGWKS